MREFRTSVRRLVEFLLRRGDIDGANAGQGGVEAMWAGSDIHRKLQAAGGDTYQAEVHLTGTVFFPSGTFSPHAARLDIREDTVGNQDGFFLTVEGRADGIIDDGIHPLTIDEIKGVTRDVATILEPDPVHEAQALTYAYLYLRKTRGSQTLSYAFADKVTIRLTYASMDTGEVRQLERPWAVPDIEAWFFDLLGQAERWGRWRKDHDETRARELTSLTFPFAPRGDQQKVMDAVTATIEKGGRLYVQAPTGSGKTIATIYPALKAMGRGEVARIVFLTAKTTTRTAALECLQLLRTQTGTLNLLAMAARDKICPLVRDAQTSQVRSRPLTTLCNPHECPLARGHYDAVNDALFELMAGYEVIDAACVTEVAARHHVCPYELQRDAARWVDLIICDYHYAFSPSASLMGIEDEPGSGDTVYLVDEAHNLPDRLRDMYSAELEASDLTDLERMLKPAGAIFNDLCQALHAATAAFPRWDTALASGSSRTVWQKVNPYDGLMDALAPLIPHMDAALEALSPTTGTTSANRPPTGLLGSKATEAYLSLHDTSLKVRSVLGALERAEKGYVTFLDKGRNGGRRLRVYCVDPAHDLRDRLEGAKAAVFFSGTLLPMDYHRKLLAAADEDPSIYATSSFDPKNQQVLISSDVTARYTQRGPALYASIASYLVTLTQARPGNYLAYLPSHAMLTEVAKALAQVAGPTVKVVRQAAGMREDDRERFVAAFRSPRSPGSSLIGLCVLGGIFGESIDLPGDQLVGVAVVGTGMPPATSEREVIRDHFDRQEDQGFAYAYTYPGVNKVLQAAGRLIRTESDRGVVLLLDDRFLTDEYQASFPKEWEEASECTLTTLPRLLAHRP